MTIVVPKTGYYIVGSLSATGLETEQVSKAKCCTCGGNGEMPCSHIQAVATYLKLGGDPAPLPEQPKVALELPDACPICSSPVIAQAGHWRCIASAGHYWQWRGEQFGVKAFLTQAHPAKAGAFYEISIEERDAFLEQISHRPTHHSAY